MLYVIVSCFSSNRFAKEYNARDKNVNINFCITQTRYLEMSILECNGGGGGHHGEGKDGGGLRREEVS